MNWKKPTFWAGVAGALAAIFVPSMSDGQVDLAERWIQGGGVVASCVLAVCGVVLPILRKRKAGQPITPDIGGSMN